MAKPADQFAEAIAVLQAIDWSFASPFSAGHHTLFDARKYHWYPATFIPEIPYSLIEVLSAPGAVVFEPFAGIGTTLFQAAALGRVPRGAEVCRVAVEVMRALWRLLNTSEALPALAARAESEIKMYRSSRDYVDDLRETAVRTELLRPWFAATTFNEICFLAAMVSRERSSMFGTAAHVCLSATLKAASAQDRGWGCVADNVLPAVDQKSIPRDALNRFLRNVVVLERDVRAVRASLSAAACEVLRGTGAVEVVDHGDALALAGPHAESVDLVVSSPPYPEMTDYCLSQRLSYYLLGVDPETDLGAEIGARRKRFRRDSLAAYSTSMKLLAGRLLKVLTPGGWLCLVMPAFRGGQANHFERRKLVEGTMREFESVGFVERTRLHRLLPARRRHHNQTWTSLHKEFVHVFEKP